MANTKWRRAHRHYFLFHRSDIAARHRESAKRIARLTMERSSTTPGPLNTQIYDGLLSGGEKYDYIIIGCGPCGLATAWLLSRRGQRCLLMDSAPSIGGCHRTIRINGVFAEHGPRIYTDKYIHMNRIHKEINVYLRVAAQKHMAKSPAKSPAEPAVDLATMSSSPLEFDKLFEPTPYPRIFADLYSRFTLREVGLFAGIFIYNQPDITLRQYMNKHNFSASASDYIDRLARLSDGSSADTTPLRKFAKLPSKGNIYKLRQPSDMWLFKWWAIALTYAGVDILLSTLVTRVSRDATSPGYIVYTARTDRGPFRGYNVVFAIPPESLAKIFPALSVPPAWIAAHSYLSYHSLTLHYPTAIPADAPSLLDSPWGLAYMPLDAYTMTVLVSKADTPGSDGRSAREASDAELIAEVIYQMSSLSLPAPRSVIIGNRPGDFPAFVDTLDRRVINHRLDVPGTPTDLPLLPSMPTGPDVRYVGNSKRPAGAQSVGGLYTVGTHNMMGTFGFTTMESAIESAYIFVNSLCRVQADGHASGERAWVKK